MNSQRYNMPIVKCRSTGKQTKWVFEMKHVNYSDKKNEDNNSPYTVFEPFFLDDISQTFTNVPVIHLNAGNKLEIKYLNADNETTFDRMKAGKCPYSQS